MYKKTANMAVLEGLTAEAIANAGNRSSCSKTGQFIIE